MIGEVIGKYRVVSELGQGGMGKVYRVEHTLLGRPAALKVLLTEHSQDSSTVDRFFNEAKAASSIQHPGIVNVYDFGYDDSGSAYIVMELLEGESLGDRLDRNATLSIDDALAISSEVCAALAAAHKQNIVHRDLKPDNVFLTSDADAPRGDRVTLLDFGVAKLMADIPPEQRHTHTGMLIGTPAYMAPEQCRGLTSIDERADLYALGCMLFRMVCGRVPFTSPYPADVLAAHLRDQPVKPSSLTENMPAGIDALVSRLLAKRPRDRFATAGELQQALTELKEAGPYEAHTVIESPRYDSSAPTQPAGEVAIVGDALATRDISSGAPAAVAAPSRLPTPTLGKRRGLVTAAAVAVVAIGAIVVWSMARPSAAYSPGPSPRADFMIYVDQLDDPDRRAVALATLEQLAAPASINTIGQRWRSSGRPPRLLRAVVAIAKKSGEWAPAAPFLREAMSTQLATTKDVDNAVVAAHSIAHLTSADAFAAVAKLIQRDGPPNHPMQRARAAAVGALAAWPKDERAALLLRRVIREGARKHSHQVHDAAMGSVGRIGDPAVVVDLLRQLLVDGRARPAARLAIVRIGTPAIPILVAVFDDKAPAFARLIAGELCQGNNRRGCTTRAAIQASVAGLLGDMNAQAAIPSLTAALAAKPGRLPDAPVVGVQHSEILSALVKLNAAGTLATIEALAANPATNRNVRGWAFRAAAALGTTTSIHKATTAMMARYAAEPLFLAAQNALADRIYDSAQLEPMRKLLAAMNRDANKPGNANRALPYLRTSVELALARAVTGARCGHRVDCYADVLAGDGADVITRFERALARPIEQRLRPRVLANVRRRALMELAKRPVDARPHLDVILAALDSADPSLGVTALASLQRVAARPCPKCVTELDRRLAKLAPTRGGGVALMGAAGVRREMRIVRAHFAGSGK